MSFPARVRELAYRLGHGYCNCRKDCVKKATQVHHKLPDTKPNRKRFPLFLNSIFNACPINHDCHLTKPLPTVTEEEAEVYEEYLNEENGRS